MELNEASKVSFIDYFRILRQLDNENKQAYRVIHQHDKDTVNYQDAYQVICGVVDDVVEQISKTMADNNQVFILIISTLISCLVKNKLINNKDVSELLAMVDSLVKEKGSN